ncbi:MAG: DUF4123 domain-containing protein [Sagittula sp.]|jgi:hypothetical protein|uniref:DUF4123 domain-containing protein n=1 Tax=unclassified Sagittula TaxID=2624628 RepID=UPI000C2D2773|nr:MULTISPECIES: DUF4123 domain-containing protein [unclassified Sagittula]AUC56075.1 hypothetical protein CDO87_22515 [Sagittula sp. P11]WHZ38038.1 DUF4123 domain-containing protein [Sagittula sp. MA-2]
MNEVVTHMSDPAASADEALALALEKACGPDQVAYLLVDASKSPATQFIIETMTDDALCLFDGQAFEDLAAYAPWLVPLNGSGRRVFDWFMEEGWNKDWGLFLIAGPEAKKVKTSLKRSLRVKTEDDKELFFKFYRPSVFNTYLPAMEPEQCAYVLRDLSQVWAEDSDNPNLVHRYAIREGTLRRADLSLTVAEDA